SGLACSPAILGGVFLPCCRKGWVWAFCHSRGPTPSSSVVPYVGSNVGRPFRPCLTPCSCAAMTAALLPHVCRHCWKKWWTSACPSRSYPAATPNSHHSHEPFIYRVFR